MRIILATLTGPAVLCGYDITYTPQEGPDTIICIQCYRDTIILADATWMLKNIAPGQRPEEVPSQGISCIFPPAEWVNLTDTGTFTLVYEATAPLVGLTGYIHSFRADTQEQGEIV